MSGFQTKGVFEPIAETEGAVVMEVVAKEHIGGGRVFAEGFESGMRLDSAHDGRPAAVGTTIYSRLAIVVWDILQQPVESVIGVFTLVGGLWVVLVPEKTAKDKCPFRLITTADILEDKDVTIE